MNEYTTENGTKLFYKVFYDLGGWNYFTCKERPRGYYLSIQRKYNQFSAFSDLSQPDGAIKYMLLEVNRQSTKQKETAEKMALDTLKDIVAVYNERGYNL